LSDSINEASEISTNFKLKLGKTNGAIIKWKHSQVFA